MAPERQILLLAIAEQVTAARDRLTARLAFLDTVYAKPEAFSVADLIAAQERLKESDREVREWCEVFDRESVA